MRIAIDGGCLGVKEERLKVGIYRFASNFLSSLSVIDKKNKYDIYTFEKIDEEVKKRLGNNFKNVVVRPSKGFLKFRLPVFFLVGKKDMYVGLSQALPWFHPFKTTVFIHDLAFEYYPNCYENYKKLSAQTKKAALESDKIITFSDKTKRDLVKIYKVDEGSIEVIRQGVDERFEVKDRKETERRLEKYKLGDYFLYVGALKKIKNVPFLIKGFSRYIKKHKGKEKLVLTGSDYWLDKEIERTIKIEGVGEQIVNLGYVEDDDLVYLYNGAKAFVSASLCEGFGHPAMEAARCGCLTILSDIDVHKENFGEVGIYFNLKSPSDLAGKLKFIFLMKEQEREKRVKIGVKISRQFRWENFSRKFLEFIEK